jgi:diguanylate cyclase (GGDEF)-like protein/PAS domain S-box-containing protein
MNIRTRVFASAALAIAATLCCAVCLWIGATRSVAADAEQEQVHTTSRAIAGLVTLTNEYALHAEPRAAQQWLQQHEALASILSAPVQSGDASPARQALRQSAAELPALFRHLTESTAQSAGPLAERRRELLIDQLLARTQALADADYRWSREAARVEQEARQWLRIVGAAALLLLLSSALAQPIIVWRRVLRPLSVLEHAAAAVARGDLTVRCASTAQDELGRVTRGFDAMTLALVERGAELHRSERRLREIADNMPALITQIDTSERYTFVNDYIERALGVSRDAVTGHSMREVCGARMYAGYAPHIRAALRGEKVAFETELVARGALRHYQSNYIPEFGDDGQVRGFYAISFDITERKEGEMRQAASEQRLRLIADNLPVLIAYIDREQRYRFCNATYEKWFGLAPSQMEGRLVADTVGEERYAPRRPFIERALAGERIEFEQTTMLPHGSRQLHALYVPHQENGVTLGLYSLITDMTEIRRNEAELMQLARKDPLTGLPNRRQFDERLVDAVARSRRTRRPMALLFLDIDRFKAINDSLGHAAGDAVLKEVAQRLKNTVRGTDTVARLAGDEFVVIVEGVDTADEAEQVARKIVLAGRSDFAVAGMIQKVTMSIGVALFECDATSPAELMARADAALYEAKTAGRDGFRLATGARPTRPLARVGQAGHAHR